METQKTWQKFKSDSHHLQAGSSHLAYFEASIPLCMKYRQLMSCLLTNLCQDLIILMVFEIRLKLIRLGMITGFGWLSNGCPS